MTITGAHVLLYTTDPDSDRAFFRDVLGFRWVDAGRGWLIFGLPPSELALHPIDNQAAPADTASAVLYLMCDDVEATVRSLESKGVSCAPLRDRTMGHPDFAPAAEWRGHRTLPADASGRSSGLA